jgi:hypothetical protein
MSQKAMHHLLLAFAITAATQTQAQEPEASLGGVLVKLPLAPNHCVLNESDPSEQRVISLVRVAQPPALRSLLLQTNCSELREWHGGKRKILGDILQYQTMADDRVATENSIARTCASVRARGIVDLSGFTESANKRLAEAALAIKVDEIRFLGVIGEDPAVCYTANLWKFRSDHGDDILGVNGIAVTVIRERFLYFAIGTDYQDRRTLDELLSRLRDGIAVLRSSNP